MKFGSPVSSVNIAGGSVTVDGGTVDASGSSSLGVISTVTGNIPATDVASAGGTGATTQQLLPNSTGTTQYILLSVLVSCAPTSGTMEEVQVNLTGTNSGVIADVFSPGNSAANLQFSLNELTLDVGAGVQITSVGSTTHWSVSLLYTTVNSSSPTVHGNVIVGGGVI